MTGGESHETLTDRVPRRRVWPVFVVLSLVAAAVALLLVRASRAPKPLRVLIAIDLDGRWWEGSQPAAALADRLAARLSKLGFEPVRSGDPEVTRTLEAAKSPEDAARSLHAAFVVTANIAPAVIEHALSKGAYYEARADAPIVVRHIDREPVSAGQLATFGGARERPRALEILAQDLADQAFDLVLPALLADESIKEMLSDRQSNLAPQIYPARDFVLARDKAVTEAREAWEEVRRKHLSLEDGAEKPTYSSAPGAHDELAASGPGGALVATNSVRPFFSPDSRRLGWINELETLEWRTLDGAPRVLWRGYNLFGYPHAASEGAPAVLIEDLFGWAKTVTVIDAAGKARRVRIDPEHRFVDPRVAPGGARVALYDRPCPTCAGSLLVLSTSDGATLLDLDREEGHFDGFTWLDSGHLALLHTASEDVVVEDRRLIVDAARATRRQALYLIDFTATPAAIEKGRPLPEGASWSMPTANAKGELLVFERRDGSGVGLWERAADTFRVRELSGPARMPVFSPDGRLLAFELVPKGSHTTEIAIAPVEAGPERVLTKNPFRDRYPQFSADGSRVLYETLADDPSYPDRRSLSFVASVPVPAGVP